MVNIPSQIIHRKRYLNALMPFIDKQIIKVLVGQRRVGKSYILYQLIQHIQQRKKQANVVYINKEDLVFSHIKTTTQLNEYINKNASEITKKI